MKCSCEVWSIGHQNYGMSWIVKKCIKYKQKITYLVVPGDVQLNQGNNEWEWWMKVIESKPWNESSHLKKLLSQN